MLCSDISTLILTRNLSLICPKFQAERLFPTPSVSRDMSMLSVGLMMTKILVFTALRISFFEGNGKLSFRNVEGLAGAPRSVKDSITAAFNYFIQNSRKLIDAASMTISITACIITTCKTEMSAKRSP